MAEDPNIVAPAPPLGQREAEKPIPEPKPKKSGNALRWTYKTKREWSPDAYRKVFALAKSQATLTECACFLGWTDAGLERQLRKHGWRDFAEFQRAAVNRTRAELRRTLVAMALSGKHPSATVFYAKSLLGISDKALEAMDRDEVESLTAAEVEARLAALDGEPLQADDQEPAKPKKRSGGHPRKSPALPMPENYGYEDNTD
jgi:hypothetical protein